MSGLAVEPIAGALGAELRGIDLKQPPGDADVAAIRRALLDHLVVFFRDQRLSPGELAAFGRRFGALTQYPFVAALPGEPDVIEVKKLPHEKVNFGGVWHSDTTYQEEPPMGSMLLALDVPPVGGDTLFANQYMACETLSAGLRRMLAGMTAVNSSAKADVTRTREDRIASNPGKAARKIYQAEHPVLRTHPETGKQALYVNAAHTVRFGGMTEEESAPLLGFLFKHQVRPEFTCRFRWQPGSLAFWDNRSAQHNPVNDYHGHLRRMHRISIAGDRPR